MADKEEFVYCCSECGAEILPSDKSCPNCGIDFDPDTSDTAGPLSEEYTILLHVYDNLIAAQSDKELLEANGIHSILKAQNWNSIFAPVIKGPQLFVLAPDYQKAKELIS
ncbi:MAG: zinc-ribbon domain-containing protein [Bacteroidota bacterium]|nr:zinc-ribbon domain-containing protein [Bacteroidota bacterium]